MRMTPRQHVETVLRGGCGSVVPFTMYESKVVPCVGERRLRNRGMCIVKRDVPVFLMHRPNVKTTTLRYEEGGRTYLRATYETPVGTLSTLAEPAGFTNWIHERPFRGPDDYRAILFMIRDEVYEPNYAAVVQAREAFGDDAIFRAQIGLEPLQDLVSGSFMHMQTFCTEWMDRRDEILRLYEALVANRRRIYPLVAESPALFANYGGNVTPEITGPKDFETYYLPHYREAAEVLHRHGKLIGSHFDANCGQLAAGIAASPLDYVEAFTPAPDTDMSLGDARTAWPDKVIWVNFPSSQHLRSDAEVTDVTEALLQELESPAGIIMGVTEDIPPDAWPRTPLAIMDGLDRHGRRHPGLYRAAHTREG